MKKVDGGAPQARNMLSDMVLATAYAPPKRLIQSGCETGFGSNPISRRKACQKTLKSTKRFSPKSKLNRELLTLKFFWKLRVLTQTTSTY
jgi:hypothetical protein